MREIKRRKDGEEEEARNTERERERLRERTLRERQVTRFPRTKPITEDNGSSSSKREKRATEVRPRGLLSRDTIYIYSLQAHGHQGLPLRSSGY